MELDRSKTILVSHPRSGLNWVRYCIEYASGLRTPGRPKLVADGEPAIYRTHDVRRASGPDSCDCIFYKERKMGRVVCGIRDRLGRPNTPVFSRMVLLLRDYHDNAVRDNWRPDRYAVNTRAYHEFAGQKHVVYYEDLKHGLDAMHLLLDSMGYSLPDDFDVDEHREKSLQWYDDKGIGLTKKPETLTEAGRTRLQAEMRRRVGAGYDELLGRYG
jgi:hypothetical protein